MTLEQLNDFLAGLGLKPMQLTPQYPGRIRPAHDGVYLVFWIDRPVYSKYKYGYWHVGATGHPDSAANARQPAHDVAPIWWQGLMP